MKKIPLFFYTFFICVFSVFSYLFVDQNLVFLKVFYTGITIKERILTTLFFGVCVVFLFASYIGILSIIKKDKIGIKTIKKLLLFVGIALFFSYPAMLSYDIFNYIFAAKVLFFYHENPYIVMPIAFLHDPLLSFTRAANKTALYGPTWILLSGMPYMLGFGNFIAILLNFKLVITIFFFGLVTMIARLSRNIYSVVLFTFNPLVVIEVLGTAHNDVVMMFFTLAAFYSLQKKKILLAWTLFIIGFFVKFSTLFLAPVFLYTTLKVFQKEKVEWENVYFFSALSMLAIFFLSPIREEMYAWYFVWFFPFVVLVPQRRILLGVSLALSLGLLLGYMPYMHTGNYFGQTPVYRGLFTFLPVVLYSIYSQFSRLWVKR